MRTKIFTVVLLGCLQIPANQVRAATADLILHHGKIVTVNKQFLVTEALAVAGGRVLFAGSNDAALKFKGASTEIIDLQGKMILPGLIDSHTHPTGASMIEFDHPIPDMESIGDVLDYIRARTKVVPAGYWIQVRQVFITRLRDQRYPTRAELDGVAPRHPVIFSTGPDASLNTPALKLSGIDKDFKVTDGGRGFAERDPATGEPTGILRNATRFVKTKTSGRSASDTDSANRLL